MAEEEKKDRLSSLPDCLLLEIISRIKTRKKDRRIFFGADTQKEERIMTTKEVIRTTSTISKRWQHLWTKLPNLIFTYDGWDLTGYFSLIDKTVTQCPTNVKLNKLEIHIFYGGPLDTRPQASSWIRHAITRNVQEVDLTIWDTRFGELFSYDDELFFNNSCFRSMRISFCEFNPPNGAIRWEKLKFLHMYEGNLLGDSIRKILSGSPCLETLELEGCFGFRRIDATSKRFKNLVISYPDRKHYQNTIEINAPYMLSLTIKGNLYLEKLLLLNVSSLLKADFNYLGSNHFSDELGRTREEELLSGLLTSLGHVKDITLGDDNCLQALSRLRNKGFQFFRVGADGDEDRITELIDSGWKKIADAAERKKLADAAERKKLADAAERKKLAVAAEREKLAVAAAAKTKKKEKVEDKEESDDDMGLTSLFD